MDKNSVSYPAVDLSFISGESDNLCYQILYLEYLFNNKPSSLSQTNAERYVGRGWTDKSSQYSWISWLQTRDCFAQVKRWGVVLRSCVYQCQCLLTPSCENRKRSSRWNMLCAWSTKQWIKSTNPLLLNTLYSHHNHWELSWFLLSFYLTEIVMLILSVPSTRWPTSLSWYCCVSLKYRALKLKEIQMGIVSSLGETSPWLLLMALLKSET